MAVELNSVTDHAPIHDQKTMEPNAMDQLMKQGHVLLKCAQHQVTVLTVLYKIVINKQNQTDQISYLFENFLHFIGLALATSFVINLQTDARPTISLSP